MDVYKISTVFLVVADPNTWTTTLTTSTTPVPILRYIDTQNTDGSYTYGFEGTDGTYKLETKYTNGQVKAIMILREILGKLLMGHIYHKKYRINFRTLRIKIEASKILPKFKHHLPVINCVYH